MNNPDKGSPHRLLLLAARRYHADDPTMICYALQAALGRYPHLQAEHDELVARVMVGLSPANSMGTYLRLNDLPNNGNTANLARMAWLDKLLEEYP